MRTFELLQCGEWRADYAELMARTACAALVIALDGESCQFHQRLAVV